MVTPTSTWCSSMRVLEAMGVLHPPRLERAAALRRGRFTRSVMPHPTHEGRHQLDEATPIHGGRGPLGGTVPLPGGRN